MRLSVNILRPRLVLSIENKRYNNSTKIYNNGAIVFMHCKKSLSLDLHKIKIHNQFH
jgi:hypothetical protein